MLELQPRCLFQTLSLRSLHFSPALLLLVCREKPQTCHRKMPPNPILLRLLCVVFVKCVFFVEEYLDSRTVAAISPLFFLFAMGGCRCSGMQHRLPVASQRMDRARQAGGRGEEKRERKKWRDHVLGFLHHGSFHQIL